MTIIKDQATGSEQDVSMTPANLQQFVEQYGPEFVHGYAQAVADTLKECSLVVYSPPVNGSFFAYHGRRIETNMVKFENHKRDLLGHLAAQEFIQLKRNDSTKLKRND